VPLQEYRQIFGEGTAVVDEEVTAQGEGLLTPEIAETLRAKGYTREDLLTSTVAFLFRKKQA
jgi:translation initiation factor 1 (eIF-1/SUI1)